MEAVYAEEFAANPLDGLRIGEQPATSPEPGWVRVQVKAASLNHHDLWTLRGVGITADRLPMTLGCDAAGVTDEGDEVLVHSVIAADPDLPEIEDPGRTLLSEKYPGSFSEYVWVPKRNLIKKPAALSFVEAACLPTAWLTAYRMLVTKSGLRPGDTVLIQGAGGGVTTAAQLIAKAIGMRVWVTSRDETKRNRSAELGADAVFGAGDRLPHRVDAVMETVGAATWEHSIKALRPGGRIVISGATSGPNPPAELTRIFFKELSVVGSTMGTKQELVQLVNLCEVTGVRPLVDSVLPMSDAKSALAAMAAGDVFGKIVLTR